MPEVRVTEETVLAVIARMEAGESESSACRNEKLSRGAFRSAALRYDAADHYARGLVALAQAQAEALEQTIDDMREGRIDHQMARVEIDARKWFASKFLPKRYGDKVEVAHTGAIAQQTDEELDTRILALLQPKP